MQSRAARSYIPYAASTPHMTIGYSKGCDVELVPRGGIPLTESGRANLRNHTLYRKKAATVWGRKPAEGQQNETAARIDVSLYVHTLSQALRSDTEAWVLEIRESTRHNHRWFFTTDEIRVLSSREAHRWLSKNRLGDPLKDVSAKNGNSSRHRINFNHHVNVIKYRRRISVIWNLFLILMGLTIIAVYLKPLIDRILALE